MPPQPLKKTPSILYESLQYLFVSELKELCTTFNLPYKGGKPELIDHILAFSMDAPPPKKKEYPQKSCAQKETAIKLLPSSLILYGHYKNDLKTRKFFKKIIGPHFHFTVFGHDWIKQRWADGLPPTYQEFADFWQQEHLLRKSKKSPLKKEWAYLNFIRRHLKKYPKSSQKETTLAWEIERKRQKKQAFEFLKNKNNYI